MKPTRNHTYCLSCRRRKILFETKEKADAFIRFNAGEILAETGKAPVRSYYCPLCCGYHVTSNPSREEGESMDARDEQMIRQVDAAVKRRAEGKELGKNLSEPIAASIEQARLLMAELRLEEARELISQILCDIKIARVEKPSWMGKGKEFTLRAEKCLSLMEEYKAAIDDPAMQDEILSSKSNSKNTMLLQVMITNHRRLGQLDGLIAEIETAIEARTQMEAVLPMIELAREKVREWKNFGIKSARAAYNTRLQQLEQKVRSAEGDEAKKEKARRKAILAAIKSAEKAASFYPDGDPSLMWFHVERAKDFLSEIEDCPEKSQVLAFLHRLTREEEAEEFEE